MNIFSLASFYDALKRNAFLVAISFTSFIFLFTLLQSLIDAEVENIKTISALETADYANNLKNQVNNKLNALIYLSSGLSGYLTAYHNELDNEKVNQVLATLYKDAKHIRNFGVAIGYQMKYVYPISENKEALNLDYRNKPDQWPLIKKVIDMREGILAGPVNLVQGGKALIYRYPVYIENEYWGILSTVIDTDSFLKDAFSKISETEYDFSVKVKSSAEQPSQIVYGKAALFNHPDAFITSSKVQNAEWEWAVVKKIKPPSPLVFLAKIMSWLVSLSMATILLLMLRDRKKLATQAKIDNLTGLPNRQMLNTKASHALADAFKHNRLMAVMFVDLDHFKAINDTYGHDTGDEALKAVTRMLLENIRYDDMLSRIGGDEFIILLNELNHAQDAAEVAKKIIAALVNPVLINNHLINIKLSIGIAIYSPTQKETTRNIMKRADIALYEAKAAGRNQYVVYED